MASCSLSCILRRPYDYCFETSVGGDVKIDKAWNWTLKSQYKEQRIFRGQFVNVWTYEVGILDSPFTMHSLPLNLIRYQQYLAN